MSLQEQITKCLGFHFSILFALLYCIQITFCEMSLSVLFFKKVLNNFNRCLRSKSLQCSLLCSTWIVHASGVIQQRADGLANWLLEIFGMWLLMLLVSSMHCCLGHYGEVSWVKLLVTRSVSRWGRPKGRLVGCLLTDTNAITLYLYLLCFRQQKGVKCRIGVCSGIGVFSRHIFVRFPYNRGTAGFVYTSEPSGT